LFHEIQKDVRRGNAKQLDEAAEEFEFIRLVEVKEVLVWLVSSLKRE
jgi:hypothetical protein